MLLSGVIITAVVVVPFVVTAHMPQQYDCDAHRLLYTIFLIAYLLMFGCFRHVLW